MAIMIFTVFIGLLVNQGIFSKSIQNVTEDTSKLVTVEMFEDLKKNMTGFLTDLLKSELTKQKQHVFFYARLPSTNVVYNKNSIVKFSDVIYNEGEHFNPGDSIFISPVGGVYLLSWTTQSHGGKHVNSELRVNNVVKDQMHLNLGGSGVYDSVTRVAICKVGKNEHVWIQTSNLFTENMFDYEHGSRSAFMGVLMYEI